MPPEQDLEGLVRARLRVELERHLGPHPTWAESPAAARLTARRRMPMRLLLVAALIVGGATGTWLLAGAPAGPTVTPSPSPSAAPAGRLILALPTHRDLDPYPTALLVGTLVLDGDCLWIQDAGGVRRLAIWPTGTSLRAVDGAPAVVDRNGVRWAGVGDSVSVGGNVYFEVGESELLGELMDSGLPTTCHGHDYWLVNPRAAALPTSSGPTPSHGDPIPSAIPGVVPAPHWPIAGVDGGNTATPSPRADGVIDEAWRWGTLAWSPNGQILAAAALSQEAGEGQVHLFDRTGHPVGALPGWDLAWVDDGHIVTLERNPDKATHSAVLWSIDAGQRHLITQRATGLLGNGRGAVAIQRWAGEWYDSAAPEMAAETYLIWDTGTLTDALPGLPSAWTADGRRLIVEHPATVGFAPAEPTGTPEIVLAAGAPTLIWIEVLAYPGLSRVIAFPTELIDGRRWRPIDPTGRWLIIGSTVFDLVAGRVERLPSRQVGLAWGLRGGFIVVSSEDHTVRAWDPVTHQLGSPFVPGATIPTADHQVVTVPRSSGDWDADSFLLSTGVVSPDWSLRAWAPWADGLGGKALHLDPEPPIPPEP